MQLLINSIQVDEEGDQPEGINCQIKGVPVYRIVFLVEIVLKGNGYGGPNNVEEDNESENAIPNADHLAMDIKLVPW